MIHTTIELMIAISLCLGCYQVGHFRGLRDGMKKHNDKLLSDLIGVAVTLMMPDQGKKDGKQKH